MKTEFNNTKNSQYQNMQDAARLGVLQQVRELGLSLTEYDIQDIVQDVACIILEKDSQGYYDNPDEGTPEEFRAKSSYRAAQYQVRNWLRSEKKQRMTSLDLPIDTDTAATLADTIPAPDAWQRLETRLIIESLPPHLAETARMYKAGYTLAETGEYLGISHVAVRKRIRKIREYL